MNHEGTEPDDDRANPNEPRTIRSFDGTPPDPPDGGKSGGFPVIVVEDMEETGDGAEAP